MDLDDSGIPPDPPLACVDVDSDDSVVVAVVRAVAAIENVSVTDLPALGDSLDPDALETLVAQPSFTGAITFEYDAYVVRVDDGGTVAIYGEPPDT